VRLPLLKRRRKQRRLLGRRFRFFQNDACKVWTGGGGRSRGESAKSGGAFLTFMSSGEGFWGLAFPTPSPPPAEVPIRHPPHAAAAPRRRGCRGCRQPAGSRDAAQVCRRQGRLWERAHMQSVPRLYSQRGTHASEEARRNRRDAGEALEQFGALSDRVWEV